VERISAHAIGVRFGAAVGGQLHHGVVQPLGMRLAMEEGPSFRLADRRRVAGLRPRLLARGHPVVVPDPDVLRQNPKDGVAIGIARDALMRIAAARLCRHGPSMSHACRV
jgi:hypothetical protein